jgi:hypothetical protein
MLPDTLIDLLSRQRDAGRELAVFWDDSSCWSRPEDALRERDWPFDDQLGYDGTIR